MNAIGLTVQQPTLPESFSKPPSGRQPIQGKQAFFQALFKKEPVPFADDNVKILSEKSNMENFNEMLDFIANFLDTSPEKLLEMLVGNDELPEELQQLLGSQDFSALFEKLSGNERLNGIEKISPDWQIPAFFAFVQGQEGVMTDIEIQQRFKALFAEAKNILSQLNEQNAAKSATNLLYLLEEWVALGKKSADGKYQMNALLTVTENGDATKEQSIWKELVQAFQKRNQFFGGRKYEANAKVTSTDISKWLQHALAVYEKSGNVEEGKQPDLLARSTLGNQLKPDNAGSGQMTLPTGPMTRMEQFVIHLNQTQGSKPMGEQLIKQFQQVIKTSRFLTLNNGNSQLSIALKPDNLGNMMVKLTQINGEMAVKILVSSQAAKEMLESNIQQLKHMFSPQQVVIERQDLEAQNAQDLFKEKEDGLAGNHDQGQPDKENEEERQEHGNDFRTQFHELLNEKV